MISVVCVFNDGEVLERRLLASLRAQTAAHELVTVDNRESEFDGAAKALNWGARRAHGDWVVFAHQDVELLSTDWLARAEEILRQTGAEGWAGVAGCALDGRQVGGILRDRAALWGEVFETPLAAQTLDECVLIHRRVTGGQDYFDEGVPGWHAYGVDACCVALREGASNYILPLPTWHDSKATNIAGLEEAHAYVWAKHGEALGRIHTVCGVLPEFYGWSGSRWSALSERLSLRLSAARYELAGYERALRLGFLETLEELTGEEEFVECLHAHAPFDPVEAAALTPQSKRQRRIVHRFEGWEANELESGALVITTDLARSVGENLERLRSLAHAARRLWLCINLDDARRERSLWRELHRRSSAVTLTRRYDKTSVAIFEIGSW
ncbi:MAG: glycosyltransferase family 2 protein [Acidobacteria bacterium]|nr:glycosyltransferase family 2 protein [Acidobacteriota bacterium]